jgi:3-hydroxyisobutyrate dehydrogenase
MAPAATAPPTGVIGLGDIGRGVAKNLLAAGVDLTVCDVRPEATEPFATGGARVAGSPAELAAHCEVAVVAVVNDAQVRMVVAGTDGLLGAARPGSAVVIVSTISTATVAEMAAAAAPGEVAVIDCGVSGGPSAAAEGTLICMVGGTDEAVERVRPVLDVLGSQVLHMGPLGAGLSAKLARNLVQYGSWLAAYEAQTLAEAAGIPLTLLAQAIRESDKRIGGASTLMFRDTVAPLRPDVPTDAGLIAPMRAAAELAHKDLHATLALADTLGLDTPLARLTDEFCNRIFGVGAEGQGEAG